MRQDLVTVGMTVIVTWLFMLFILLATLIETEHSLSAPMVFVTLAIPFTGFIIALVGAMLKE